jgi:hypothetical protein
VYERLLPQLLLDAGFAQLLFHRGSVCELVGRCFRLLPLAQEPRFQDQSRLPSLILQKRFA